MGPAGRRATWLVALAGALLLVASCEAGGATRVGEADAADSIGLADGLPADVGALGDDAPGAGDRAIDVASFDSDVRDVWRDTQFAIDSDAGPDVSPDDGDAISFDEETSVLSDVGLDVPPDGAAVGNLDATTDGAPDAEPDVGTRCAPSTLEDRCCCAWGVAFPPHCESDGTWICPSPFGWAEGDVCGGGDCGGPCGPPCPNTCDAPDTDPGCPGGWADVGDGACAPRACAAAGSDPAGCPPAPVVSWGGGQNVSCAEACGEAAPCVSVGTWTGTIPTCFSEAPSDLVGLYRTEDGGRCWRRIPAADVPFPPYAVRMLIRVPAPEEAALVLADGVYRTTNTGRSFTRVANVHASFGQVTVHPLGAVYLIGRRPQDGADRLWRSEDGGASFVQIAGVSMGTTDPGRPAVSPADPELVLVPGRFSGATASFPVLRVVDGGAAVALVGPKLDMSTARGRAIAFAPGDPLRVYLALSPEGLYRSDDAGVTWEMVAANLSATSIEVHPIDPNWLRAGDRVSRDGGATWSDAGTEDDAVFRRGHEVCPDDAGPCDRWSGFGFFRHAHGDGPWLPAMTALPFSASGLFWLRPTYLVPLLDERALTVVEFQRAILF